MASAMSRPPAVVSVLSRPVKVSMKPSSAMPEAYGQWFSAKQRIDIRTRMSQFDTVDTFLHELFHAILSNQGRTYGESVEEQYVAALATGLTTVLKDNPSVRAYLGAEIK